MIVSLKMKFPSLLSCTSYTQSDFVTVKSRRVKKTPDLEEDVDNGADGPSNASKTPFACLEEECSKSYKRYFSLLKHMECGRHKLSLECETLYDRALLGYASRLEHGTTAAPELGKAEFFPNFSAPSLPMGWAPNVLASGVFGLL